MTLEGSGATLPGTHQSEVSEMPYVRAIQHHEAQGELKEIYDGMLEARGTIANVSAVSSLRPHIMKTLSPHNTSVMRGELGLTPAERQMVATVVSAVNRCQY